MESPITNSNQNRDEGYLESPTELRFPMGAKNQFEMGDLSICNQTVKSKREIHFSEDFEKKKSERMEDIVQLVGIFGILCFIIGFAYFIYWYFFVKPK